MPRKGNPLALLVGVGQEQLAKMVWSGSLAPQPLAHLMFGNNDSVTCSTVHVCYELLALSRGTLLVAGCCVQYAGMSFTMKALAAAALGLPWSGIIIMLYEVMLWLLQGSVMVMLWPLLQLLRQPGDRLCYGCQASQEKIKASAVPMAPSSLSASSLPTLGSANYADSVNGETIGITNKMKSNTLGM